MFIGEILKELIVKVLALLVSVFVDIVLKNTILIIFRPDKSTAEEILKEELVNANSFVTFQFVSIKFLLIYIVGSQDLKCLCKHSCHDHEPNGIRKCLKPGCKGCGGFSSKHHCNCGLTFNEHETVFESREERELAGRPVDPKWMQEQNMIGGMGGLTADYQSLVDGQDLKDMRNP